MAAGAEEAEVDELARDVGVDDADDDGGHDDEGEGGLLVGDDAERAEGWRRRVLAQEVEAEGRGHDEQDGGDGGQHGERLGEVLRPLHLRDEGREEDLRHPEKGDVEHGVHTGHPGGAGLGEGVRLDGAEAGIGAAVAVERRLLDPGEDEEEQNGDGHARRREHGHERDVVEGARGRHDHAHHGRDDGEDDGARAVVREGVEDLGPGEDVEANEQDVVGQQHEARELVGHARLAAGVVGKVADVFDLGMLHDEPVHGERGDPEEDAGHGDRQHAGQPTEDGERPRLRHDGEAHLVAGEQAGRLLPGHGAEFDGMAVVCMGS